MNTPASQRRTGLSIDQLPVLALGLLLVINWIGADFFVANFTVTKTDPFVPVWQAYSFESAAALLPWALGGLVLAALVPLASRMPIGAVAQHVRVPVERFFALWVIVAVMGLGLALAAKGKYLLYAPAYLTFAMPPSFVSLSNVLLPVTLLASGVVSSRRPLLGALLAVGTGLVLFSTATRVLAGVVGLFMLGRFIAGAKVSILGWLSAALYALLALPIPLICREQSAHGLIPYAEAVGALASHSGYLHSSLIAAAENTGFTVPLLIYTAHAPGITLNDMMISLNPMSGASAGWDLIMKSMRVHDYIPFSMLGEFASFGPVWLLVCTFGWGITVRWAINSATHAAALLMVPLMVGQLGLSLMSMVQLTQYNTRAVARVLSMIIGLALVERILRPVFRAEFWKVRGGWGSLLAEARLLGAEALVRPFGGRRAQSPGTHTGSE